MKNILIILSVIALLAFITVTVISVILPDKIEIPLDQNNVMDGQTEKPVAYELYRNTDYGFLLEYPNNLEIQGTGAPANNGSKGDFGYINIGTFGTLSDPSDYWEHPNLQIVTPLTKDVGKHPDPKSLYDYDQSYIIAQGTEILGGDEVEFPIMVVIHTSEPIAINGIEALKQTYSTGSMKDGQLDATGEYDKKNETRYVFDLNPHFIILKGNPEIFLDEISRTLRKI